MDPNEMCAHLADPDDCLACEAGVTGPGVRLMQMLFFGDDYDPSDDYRPVDC